MVRIRLVPRVRFSLRTFFVALMLLSLIGSNLFVSWQWDRQRKETRSPGIYAWERDQAAIGAGCRRAAKPEKTAHLGEYPIKPSRINV
jgi:hypothetical protein